jgi:orotate phosphoribosyltransferase
MATATRSSVADRARLIEIIKARSFQTGTDMKLVSGRVSNFYFNMKPTMLDPEGGYLIGQLILDALDGIEADWIGGLEMGAVPIGAAVAALSHARGRRLPAFFVRKQVKEHGTKRRVEGLAKGETLRDRRVIIVEDVTTTGGSALKAVEAVRAEGADVLRVITIVDRQEGARDAFRAAGLAFAPLLTIQDFS